MSQEITLFTDYQKRENLVTNYCGLILKLVYEESPQLFNRFLDICCAEDGYSPIVGPVFEQQKKMTNSVPDLLITQQSFQVLFEVKTTNWYYEDQLNAHANSFTNCVATKILVLLCNFDEKNGSVLLDFKTKMHTANVLVVLMTFEELLEYFTLVCTTPSLKRYLEEFRHFLDRNNLLPTWKYTLDVVNCCITKNEVLNDCVFMCPDTGRQYSHKRARYLGAYWDKAVRLLFEVDAVVDVPLNFNGKMRLLWNNSSLSEYDLQKRAKAAVKKYCMSEISHNGILVFLLSNQHKVCFEKDTAGGMYGAKTYFTIKCQDIDELAAIINGKEWKAFR